MKPDGLNMLLYICIFKQSQLVIRGGIGQGWVLVKEQVSHGFLLHEFQVTSVLGVISTASLRWYRWL